MMKYQGKRYHSRTETTPFHTTEEEFDTMDEAKAYAEATGAGEVITWHVGPNLPGCLPALRYSSCALDVFDNGAWRGVNIF
jgi:hypothetical protein